MNRIRGWLSPPSTPPTSHESLSELGASASASDAQVSQLSSPLHDPSTMSSTTSAPNALGLAVNSPSPIDNDTNTIRATNDSLSSLSSSPSRPGLAPKTTSTSRQSKPPTIKATFRQRLSSFARRDNAKLGTKNSKATRHSTAFEDTSKPAETNGKPGHLHVRSDPVIETIRASPEDLVGPSAARGAQKNDPSVAADGDRGRLRRGEDRNHLLTSDAHSVPRGEHAGVPELQRLRSVRSSTSPIPDHVHLDLPRTPKRLIVCCDGTWQDGISQNRRWRYSNVLKLSRCIDHEDVRTHPPTPQIVFYQSGLGTQDHVIGQLVDGAFGAHLAEKVQEVYAWIAQNYYHGDEIFLFGFSRGAYTARMVATFIGEIGLLSRSKMDKFADIFIAYQKKGKTTDPEERKKYDELLAPYQNAAAYGRSKFKDRKFSVKVVGVFDTVGALGLPAEFTRSEKIKRLFDFPDRLLPQHIERAYHAMALNEQRADFNVTKFYQKPEMRVEGQFLRQMWFSGSHSDVGGGFQDHDLSDLALIWMVAEIEDCLAIDLKYLKGLPRPVKPWGKQTPHYSRNGIFALGSPLPRVIEGGNRETCERVHSSVLEQTLLDVVILDAIKEHPHLVARRLLPLEEEMRSGWNYDPGKTPPRQDTSQAREEQKREKKHLESVRDATKKAARKGKSVFMDGISAVANAGEAVADSASSSTRTRIGRASTHYDDSAVKPVWDEINSDT